MTVTEKAGDNMELYRVLELSAVQLKGEDKEIEDVKETAEFSFWVKPQFFILKTPLGAMAKGNILDSCYIYIYSILYSIYIYIWYIYIYIYIYIYMVYMVYIYIVYYI